MVLRRLTVFTEPWSWCGNEEAASSTFWFQVVWGWLACGQHTVNFLHLVGVSVSAKQFTYKAQNNIYDLEEELNKGPWLCLLAEVLLVWLVWLFSFSFCMFSLLWLNSCFKIFFYFLCSDHITQQVGFLLPNQRSNLRSLQWKFRVFTHWTLKEVPKFILWWKFFYRQNAGGRLGWGFILGKPHRVLPAHHLAPPLLCTWLESQSAQNQAEDHMTVS